jgi:hypothetical protein
MQFDRWIDHMPPWASWTALAMAGVFSGWELFFMALPLMMAALVEVAKLQLYRWRRYLEISCLVGFLACWFVKVGWVIAIILLLFMLCGARLSLPREPSHRRQVIFMSFLLFLLTTVANTSISFLPMALIWTAIACLALLQLNWENASSTAKAPASRPPMRSVAIWTSAAVLIGSALFLMLPRPILRWRPLPFGIHGFAGPTAGLADSLSLDDIGIIQGNSEVVARILPPPGTTQAERKGIESRMALLTGFRLEVARNGKWERGMRTPSRRDIFVASPYNERPNMFEYYVYPSPTGLIPMPQGYMQLIPPPNMRIEFHSNGMTRWQYPLARPMPFKFWLWEPRFETISGRYQQRLELSTPDPATVEALHWSQRIAPGPMHPTELVGLLTRELHTFKYTMGNPSGGAKDPLADFLTNTKAGHCEYFAHALASALHHRGIATRVVNGYRLGPWIEEGGYWLVSQNQAHSWVEYADPDLNVWLIADPTPPGAASYSWRWRLTEKFSNIADAMRFRWDRYVVRFSDEEQQKGFSWAQQQASRLRGLVPDKRTALTILAIAALVASGLAAWKNRKYIGLLIQGDISPGAVLALRPLIRAARLYPSAGETIRAWLKRLGEHRPDRSAPLMQLAELIESRVYGQSDADIAQPIKAEAKEWRAVPKSGNGPGVVYRDS